MNQFNLNANEKIIMENDYLKKCYEQCLKQSLNEYYQEKSYKIKNKIYSDYDDKKYFEKRIYCFDNCFNK